MSLPESLLPEVLPFEIEFEGAEAAPFREAARAGLRLPIARLEGARIERMFENVAPAGESHGFDLYEGGGLLIGCAVEPVRHGMEQAAAILYRRLLAAAGRRSLYRIWNYVPDINGSRDGLENYRAFSSGRAQAFEEALGRRFAERLPAASAVGHDGPPSLAAVFVAGRAPCRHIENPEQIPAYRYPPEHGPRSPAFCRASAVEVEGRMLVFISGTAAIKGHRTVSPDAIDGQLDCTLHNLDLIFQASGLGGATSTRRRIIRVFLRRAADLAGAKSRLEEHLGLSSDQVVWLQAPLCRRELLIEVEATVAG